MHEPSVLKNPFTYTPPIRGYLGYAYLLSILFAQENPPWPWLYNQYIAIGARRDYSRFEQIATDWMGVYEGAMQYYFMELPVEQVADPDQGLQAILSLLRRGYYVYGEFNERYVPHTSSYRRWDFRHCYCLYGYSREQHLLFSAAYSDTRRYEELEIPFSDYLRALAESGREKITIDFYRCNPAFVPVFDPESCAVHKHTAILMSIRGRNCSSGQRRSDICYATSRRCGKWQEPWTCGIFISCGITKS